MTRTPNVLFVVWDACRYDTASEHAPTLASLAEDNLWFENTIAPSIHSLASHVSLLTGEYPAEHGIHQPGQMPERLPVLENLGADDYTNYGVSANGFASPMYGFDRRFDQFFNTQGRMVYTDGLDIQRYAREVRGEDDTGAFDTSEVDPLHLLRAIASHNHPVKSAINVAAAGVQLWLGTNTSIHDYLPHPRLSQYSEFCYSPQSNTEVIEDVLERESRTDDPFLVFTNYMDAHHPYAPSEHYQREYCGRTFSHREISNLAKITHPLNYLQRRQDGEELSKNTLETVRNLYRGEVRTVDDHLSRLLDTLDRNGLRENTIIVVTADHGDNLGETDAMGETKLGHVSSASEHVLHTPLVVAHPDLDGRRIEEYVSLKDVLPAIATDAKSILESSGRDLDALIPSDGLVSSQIPPMPHSAPQGEYPELDAILDREMSVTYGEDWKVVGSDDDEYVWEAGEERSVADAPDPVVETCREKLVAFAGSDRADLTGADEAHLEALGYL